MQQLMQHLQSVLQYPWLVTTIWIIGLVVAAFVINFLVHHLLLRGSYTLLNLIDHGRNTDIRMAIRYLTHIAPALVLSYGVALIPGIPHPLMTVVQNVAAACVILTIALTISALLNFIQTLYYRSTHHSKHVPIKGLMQIVKIVVFFIAAILMLSAVIDQSPLILLSGLGAMAAVLILVFQDTLLSFVAGIQISSTDMIRVGDWIEIPNLGADGDVIDIALHSVTVQNFDKTITNVPIRKLVTDPFKNWRGMQESGGRRIKRSLNIDQSSINFLTEQDITRLLSHRHIKAYIKNKQQEIAEWNNKLDTDEALIAGARRLTNIGTFRAYILAYIKNHPCIRNDMTILVRHLAPGPEGLPLEIYCFTNTVNWNAYEEIQADIFDHLYSIMPDFSLRVFQAPSGSDMQLALASLQAAEKAKSS